MSEIGFEDSRVVDKPVPPEASEVDNRELKQQYTALARLSKDVREYIFEHPESESKVVLGTLLNDDVRSYLTDEQIAGATQSIEDLSTNRGLRIGCV